MSQEDKPELHESLTRHAYRKNYVAGAYDGREQERHWPEEQLEKTDIGKCPMPNLQLREIAGIRWPSIRSFRARILLHTTFFGDSGSFGLVLAIADYLSFTRVGCLKGLSTAIVVRSE